MAAATAGEKVTKADLKRRFGDYLVTTTLRQLSSKEHLLRAVGSTTDRHWVLTRKAEEHRAIDRVVERARENGTHGDQGFTPALTVPIEDSPEPPAALEVALEPNDVPEVEPAESLVLGMPGALQLRYAETLISRLESGGDVDSELCDRIERLLAVSGGGG